MWQGHINQWCNIYTAHVRISQYNHKWRQLKPLLDINFRRDRSHPGWEIHMSRLYHVLLVSIFSANMILTCSLPCVSLFVHAPPLFSILPPQPSSPWSYSHVFDFISSYLVDLNPLPLSWCARLPCISCPLLSLCLFDLFYMSFVPLVSCLPMLTCLPMIILYVMCSNDVNTAHQQRHQESVPPTILNLVLQVRNVVWSHVI